MKHLFISDEFVFVLSVSLSHSFARSLSLFGKQVTGHVFVSYESYHSSWCNTGQVGAQSLVETPPAFEATHITAITVRHFEKNEKEEKGEIWKRLIYEYKMFLKLNYV